MAFCILADYNSLRSYNQFLLGSYISQERNGGHRTADSINGWRFTDVHNKLLYYKKVLYYITMLSLSMFKCIACGY